MTNTFEIKFKDKSIHAEAIMLTKKITKQSIAQIKQSAEQNVPFFGCELSDDKNLSLIIKLYEELKLLNIETMLLEDGEIETIEYFRNVLESHRETARYVGLDDEDIDY